MGLRTFGFLRYMALGVLLLPAPALAQQGNTDLVNAALAEAEQYLGGPLMYGKRIMADREQVQAAHQRLQYAHNLRPQDPDLLVRLGMLHHLDPYANAQTRNLQAYKLADRVLNQHPKHAGALRLKAAVVLAGGNPTYADDLLNQAMMAEPDNPATLYLKAQALANTNPQRAQRLLDQALALDPTYAPARLAKAQTAPPDQALDALNALLDDDAQSVDPDLLHQAGRRLLADGKATQSIPFFDRALELNNAQPEYYISRGKANLSIRERKAGCQDLANALLLLNRQRDDDAKQRAAQVNMVFADRCRKVAYEAPPGGRYQDLARPPSRSVWTLAGYTGLALQDLALLAIPHSWGAGFTMLYRYQLGNHWSLGSRLGLGAYAGTYRAPGFQVEATNFAFRATLAGHYRVSTRPAAQGVSTVSPIFGLEAGALLALDLLGNDAASFGPFVPGGPGTLEVVPLVAADLGVNITLARTPKLDVALHLALCPELLFAEAGPSLMLVPVMGVTLR